MTDDGSTEDVIEEPEGRAAVRFDWLRRTREPLWVIALIICIPLFVAIAALLLRLLGFPF